MKAAMLIPLALAGVARSETLADAFALACQTNPTPVSQRARLQARLKYKTYIQAHADFRPAVRTQEMVGYNRSPQTAIK